MPRNPNSPHNHNCGPVHTHTSASENIKLQMMMAKLEDSLKNEFVLKEQLKTINLESLLGSGNIDIKSIDRIEKASEGLVDTYTIYFINNAEPYSFTVTNGAKGEKGDKGDKGDTGAQGVQGERGADGADGADGYTPVLGIDYFTDEDKEQIQDDCDAYILAELEKRAQLKPEFANNINECEDITKLYVLPDGNIYAYMYSGAKPEITIELLDGSYFYYNGGNPYLYTPDSGNVSSKRTNLIPVDEGDILKVKVRGTKGHECNGCWYDENNNMISTIMIGTSNSQFYTEELTAPAGAKYVQIYSMSWSSGAENVVLEAEWVYCAASLVPQWANTNHAFVPADYEAEILDLDNRINTLENSTSNILKGKTIVFDGDSIVANWVDTANNINNGGAYPKMIQELTGCISVNKAVGGGVIRSEAITGGSRHSVVDTLTSLPTDADLYCFEGGVNDYSSETPLGTYSPTDYSTDYINNLDTSTFCGALEKICSYSMENFLGKPICFVIVHKAPYCAYMKNDIGLTFADYREKIIGILEKYSIPYYDAFKESGLNGLSEVHRANYFIINKGATTGDGWHPNIEGYKKYYVPQLINLFEKIMPRD